MSEINESGTLHAAIGLVQALHKLNKGQPKLNKDKYTSLITRKRKVETWWNGLGFEEKMEVGSAALHFRLMSANYKWKCRENENDGSGSLFEELSKSQKKIVKFVFSKRNDKYSMFDMVGILGLR